MRTVIFIIFFLSLVNLSHVDAAMYKYTDEHGEIFYADRLEAIPQQYIHRVQIIDNHLENAGLMIENERPDTIKLELLKDTRNEIMRHLEKANELLVNSDLVKYVIIIIIFFFISILLFRVREYIGPRKAGMMFAVIIGIFAFIFVYSMYLNKVFDTYADLSEKTSELRKQAEERSRQSEQMMDLNKRIKNRKRITPPWESEGSHEE